MRQPDLFSTVRDRAPPPPVRPDPATIRARLHAMLEAARAAHRIPWDENRASCLETGFHQMANWLPEQEREELRAAFRAEMERLRVP